MPNLVALQQMVWVYVGGPKTLEALSSWPLD